MVEILQKIVVFQQNNSGVGKIEGITRFGKHLLNIEEGEIVPIEEI